MPIRLNLLAEAQAAEELRRRDPVKRAIWLGALFIAIMLVWSSSLQLKAMLASRELTRDEALMNSHTNEYRVVLDHQRRVGELNDKLLALRQLTTNRFLNGSLLNALQQSSAEDVQLIRLRVDQGYSYTDGVKPRTNDNRVIPGKPALVTEKIIVSLDGTDSSQSPGDAINKYKQSVATNTYFQTLLSKTNEVRLAKLSPPQLTPGTGKPSVQFTLECRYPEKTR
jgi:hypothetical protein